MFDINTRLIQDEDGSEYFYQTDKSIRYEKSYARTFGEYETTKVDLVQREQRINYYSMLVDRGLPLFPEHIAGLIEYHENC